ncbi:MAG: hypothetical protein JWM44_1171 [Bacilli bacterium]|nr:hypothetical protein [Bacilli bacterium]
MFDPTIYENMKIIIEGAVYDLDLAGNLLVTNRSDRVELSTMSRAYFIQFKLLGKGETVAEIYLAATTADLSAEILEKSSLTPGCIFEISFMLPVHQLDEDCIEIQQILQEIWGDSCVIKQKLFFEYGEGKREAYGNEVVLDFGRKFSESIVDDIPSLLDHIMISLQQLNQIGSDSDS